MAKTLFKGQSKERKGSLPINPLTLAKRKQDAKDAARFLKKHATLVKKAALKLPGFRRWPVSGTKKPPMPRPLDRNNGAPGKTQSPSDKLLSLTTKPSSHLR